MRQCGAVWREVFALFAARWVWPPAAGGAAAAAAPGPRVVAVQGRTWARWPLLRRGWVRRVCAMGQW